MKLRLKSFLPVIIFAAMSSLAFISAGGMNSADDYFPANSMNFYESTFGECYSRFYHENNLIVSSTISEKFKYKQTFIVQDKGLFIKETYQSLKDGKKANKEATITYSKPLLRLPFPLNPGQEWKSESIQYDGPEKCNIKLTGKCTGMETVQTKAGKYDAYKIQTVIECSNGSKNEITEWYAKGVGLVKAKVAIQGSGNTGVIRDTYGHGTLEFNLKQIRK
ncbi:MAG: hypothetical protein ACM3RX_03945 [Methanococcaceae archaeon]